MEIDDDEIKIGYLPNFASITYDINNIVYTIIKLLDENNIDAIKDIIIKQHEIIFSYNNLINENRKNIQNLFISNFKFVDLINEVVRLLTLSFEEEIFLNKMVYDYFEYINCNSEVNPQIKDKLLSISYNINSQQIISFSAKMNITQARTLAIIRKSSFKIEKVIHRVNNFFIENVDLSVDDMIYLYNLLYSESDLNSFFCYSMFEYSPGKGEILKKFNNISKVIIEILDNLDFSILKEILSNYGNMINIMSINKDNLRFKFKEVLTDPNSKLSIYIRTVEQIYDIYIP